MAGSLKGKKVALLVTDGFEQVELTEPRKALEQAGAMAQIVSPKDDAVRGWDFTNWGETFPVDVPLTMTDATEYDALVLPGGQINPDTLRMNRHAVQFVRDFLAADKPVAAICHGPWLLVEADGLQGRRATSYPSIQTDLKNAGAQWVDEPAVVDGNLLTSRSPDDLPQFNEAMIQLIAGSTATV